MTESVNAPKPRFLPKRRLALLASAAGLGAALMFAGAGFVTKPNGSILNTVAYAPVRLVSPSIIARYMPR